MLNTLYSSVIGHSFQLSRDFHTHNVIMYYYIGQDGKWIYERERNRRRRKRK
jgi:hypothetical protein